MKKLLTALFLLYASSNFAQIILEHTYTTTVQETQTGPSTWNYYTYNSSSIEIYDISHSLVDTKQYAPGEYFYYIHSDNFTSPASKFIITR